MNNYIKKILWLATLASPVAYAHGPIPISLKGVPIPPVPGLTDGNDPIVLNKAMAIALGKALFWDMNVGSDGIACASCHFHAGADSRVKNQLNPGQKSPRESGQKFSTMPSGNQGGPNYTLSKRDFPLHRRKDPFDKFSEILYDTDDVVSSAGSFHGQFLYQAPEGSIFDFCNRSQDHIFHVGATNTRQVEPRNTPSVINAIFNHRNFWDGRANNTFNGSNNWGDRDPNAGVWIKTTDNKLVKQRLTLINSSLASLSVAPPLNELEMSCQNRSFLALARKLLHRRALEQQLVHPNDSVLGKLSLNTEGRLQKGLNLRYRDMIRQAFNEKYWSYANRLKLVPGAGNLAYLQMEANFPMFLGLSMQLYMSTLISDDTPFDRAARDANGKPIGLSKAEQHGLELFVEFHCNVCHAGPLMTSAAIATNAQLVEENPRALGPGNAAKEGGISRNIVNHDAMVNFVNRFMDFGFFNTGVIDSSGDPGLASLDPFGNPYAFTDQYFAYLQGDLSKVVDKHVGIEKNRSCDFIKPLALMLPDASSASFYQLNYFTSAEANTILPDPNGNTQCINTMLNQNAAYIPTPAEATKAINDPNNRKIAKATQGAFKVPSLRNIALTSPYMHNGSLSTLEQVVEFYSRGANYDSAFKHSFLIPMSTLQIDKDARADLIAFMRSLSDERVIYEKAPFDHPELIIGHGHKGNNESTVTGNPIAPNLAQDDLVVLPAVGAEGTLQPQTLFENNLLE